MASARTFYPRSSATSFVSSSGRDYKYLSDMLAAVAEIREFTRGLDEAQFGADLRTRRAVERALEILSEAQKNVSAELKIRHPEVPWRSMHDLGNFYRHAYFNIDIKLVWQAATGDDLDRIEKMLRDELPFGTSP
jgi:uncharacterized protein with HEPN domain